MEFTPKYLKPILYSNQPVTQLSYWDDAVTAFDEKEYEETFTATLNYMNKDILKGRIVTDGMDKIIYPHGSSEIHIRYHKGMLSFCAPFLKVPEKHKVPLLRKVAEVNFSPLTLAQIVYSKDEEILQFQYNMPIELAQPNKVYDLLKEICYHADEYDHEFIQKYQASFYHTPSVENISKENLETAWHQIETYLDDALSYIEYFEKKRMSGFVWDTIANTLLQIVDQPFINGNLRTTIEKKLWFLRNDEKADLERKNNIGKSFLNELKAKSKEAIQADLFLTKKFLSPKYRSTVKGIADYLQDAKDNIENDIEAKNWMGAFYRTKYALLNLIYNYNIEPEYWHLITNSIAEAAENPWESGATKLKKTFDLLISGDYVKESTALASQKKKGFFARLFS